ncbi:MAG: electron transfer flavoprotein subunit beta/FixA family protein [Spirochaetes bacterium]|nr:electron transfer flavoprotein subunit beta/FixA family protein [Spirochaetota bacterium]
MLNIIVCVKQVPDTDQILIDEEKGTLIRSGVPAILNPFCEYALDEAVRLKSIYRQSKITTITLGPPQAKKVLQRCLELGADEAYHLCDSHFAGSDCLATAYILSTAIRELLSPFDLILTGKQAIDGDTAQVPCEMAEILDLDQVNYALNITRVDSNQIRIKGENERGYLEYEATLPLVVTISGGSNIRRFPSLQAILTSRKKKLHTIGFDDLSFDKGKIGLKGSPTRVVKIAVPVEHKEGKLLEYSKNSQLAVSELLQIIDPIIKYQE